MSQKGMTRIGTVIAIVVGVLGLAAVAFFIFAALLMQSFGSNK